MSRAALAACALLAACSEPQVFLAEKPFAWQSAVAIPFEYETGVGMHRATMLMVTDRPDACRSLEDLHNYCNFRFFPDVAAFGFWSMARPVGAKGPTLLALLKDTDVGEVDTLPRVSDPSQYGLTLVEQSGARVRTTSYRAWIERIEAGRTVEISFNGTLSDGRSVRGEVEAQWCEGLLLSTRDDLSKTVSLNASAGGRVEEDALVESLRTYGCFDVTITTRCAAAPKASQASCECSDTSGRAAQFSVPRAEFENFFGDCPLRFGQP